MHITNVYTVLVRVLIVSKALIVGAYQRKAEELAKLPGMDLTVAIPPYWREGAHRIQLERAYLMGYKLVVLPMVFNGRYHVHFYRRLGALLDSFQPHVFHIDEEQHNLATYQGMRLAATRSIPALFYTWQNIDQRYPPPFSFFERYNLRHAAYAMAGNAAAAAITREKGYKGPIAVIPQFGVDPEMFHLRTEADRGDRFVIGFVAGAGRLIAAKGLHVLLDALGGLPGDWELRVIGTGEAREPAEEQVRRLGISSKTTFLGTQASTVMPDVLRGFDLLVGPSLTTAHWKEQFGRMLVEAMSCGVSVIGSTSGEIPHVLGDAGVVTPEGDSAALRAAIARLMDDKAERVRRTVLGRQRVLDLYTQEAIARQSNDVYEAMARR